MYAVPWASECPVDWFIDWAWFNVCRLYGRRVRLRVPGCQKLQMTVWHRMLYSYRPYPYGNSGRKRVKSYVCDAAGTDSFVMQLIWEGRKIGSSCIYIRTWSVADWAEQKDTKLTIRLAIGYCILVQVVCTQVCIYSRCRDNGPQHIGVGAMTLTVQGHMTSSITRPYWSSFVTETLYLCWFSR